MLNEKDIDMAEFEALRKIQHVDKRNRNRFIAFYKRHIDPDPRGVKTCKTCWDRMRALRDELHLAWDQENERLRSLIPAAPAAIVEPPAPLPEPPSVPDELPLTPPPYSLAWIQQKLEEYKNQK